MKHGRDLVIMAHMSHIMFLMGLPLFGLNNTIIKEKMFYLITQIIQ